MTSWTTNCNCKYYSYDLDEKFENDFNPVALGDLL